MADRLRFLTADATGRRLEVSYAVEGAARPFYRVTILNPASGTYAEVALTLEQAHDLGQALGGVLPPRPPANSQLSPEGLTGGGQS